MYGHVPVRYMYVHIVQCWFLSLVSSSEFRILNHTLYHDPVHIETGYSFELKTRVGQKNLISCMSNHSVELIYSIPGCFFILNHNPASYPCHPLYQWWWSVTFWCGSESESPDPYLWLMDQYPDPAPARLLSSLILRMLKKICFNFFDNLPTGKSSSVYKIKFFAKILY